MAALETPGFIRTDAGRCLVADGSFQEKSQSKDIESAIEAILFASGDPVSAERLAGALELDEGTVRTVAGRIWLITTALLRRGNPDAEDRWKLSAGLCAGVRPAGAQGDGNPTAAPVVSGSAGITGGYRLFPTHNKGLCGSRSRGVDSSYTVGLLAGSRGLIEECGRPSRCPGRPICIGRPPTSCVLLDSKVWRTCRNCLIPPRKTGRSRWRCRRPSSG